MSDGRGIHIDDTGNTDGTGATGHIGGDQDR